MGLGFVGGQFDRSAGRVEPGLIAAGALAERQQNEAFRMVRCGRQAGADLALRQIVAVLLEEQPATGEGIVHAHIRRYFTISSYCPPWLANSA